MAIDAVTCYTYNVNNIKDELFVNGLTGWTFNPNESNRHRSSFDIWHDGIHLNYRPFHRNGTLRIKFNVPKLITGDNISSIFCCNIQRLSDILGSKLTHVIRLSKAPALRFWKVSKVENNINIIRDKATINSLYSLLANLDRTRHFTKLCIYKDRGTIYMGNGMDLDNSTRIVKFYLKLRQIRNANPHLDIAQYYDSSLIKLRPSEDILRLEIVSNRDALLESFRPHLIYASDPEYYNSNKKPTVDQQIATLEEVMDYGFQTRMLNKIIKEFHLDKLMTTKDTLFKLIDNSCDLNSEEKKTAKSVVNKLNLKSKYHKKSPSKSSIRKYKNWILNQGYHYLYADVEIVPIVLDDIISDLPAAQISAIDFYRYSNIFRDVAFYNYA